MHTVSDICSFSTYYYIRNPPRSVIGCLVLTSEGSVQCGSDSMKSTSSIRSHRSAWLLFWGNGKLGSGDLQRKQPSPRPHDLLHQEQRDHSHHHRSWASTHGELFTLYLFSAWTLNWCVCGTVVREPRDSALVEWGLAERGLRIVRVVPGSRPRRACVERGEKASYEYTDLQTFIVVTVHQRFLFAPERLNGTWGRPAGFGSRRFSFLSSSVFWRTQHCPPRPDQWTVWRHLLQQGREPLMCVQSHSLLLQAADLLCLWLLRAQQCWGCCQISSLSPSLSRDSLYVSLHHMSWKC